MAATTSPLDDALAQIARLTEPHALHRAVDSALELVGFKARWPNYTDLAPPDELSAEQRRLIAALADRVGVAPGCGVPRTARLRRRWLGLEPPSAIDRVMPYTHEGRRVEWPVWRVWRAAPLEALEHNQGVPAVIAEFLSPAELIEAAAEAMLEPYGLGYPLEARVNAALDAHAAEAVGWAAGFITLLASIGPPPRPLPRPDYDYPHVSAHVWPTLCGLALRPLVQAGRALDPAWDAMVPYTDRVILGALPPARREAIVYDHLTTDWTPPEVFNGLGEGMRVVDLAPSERVAAVLVSKLRNPRNRGFIKRTRDAYVARLEQLAQTEPGVASALRPRRKSATSTAPDAKPRATKQPAPRR